MKLNLEGKLALVAASSKGLGFACADALAGEGAKITICARGEKALAQAVAKLTSNHPGVRVASQQADLGTLEGVNKVVTRAVGKHGRIDVLVTNVGGPPRGPFSAFDDDAWASAVEVTIMPVVRLIRACLPHMPDGSAIVNIQSSAVKEPIPDLLLSNTLRPAVLGMSKTLSRELGKRNIRINTVAPGSFDTDRIHMLIRKRAEENGISEAEEEKNLAARAALGRIGKPSELGSLVAFLASDAAGYITGQTIFCDGGMTAFSF